MDNEELYKQLKRLEQENEKLKKEVKQIGSAFIKKGDYARELEQENKKLISALEEIRDYLYTLTTVDSDFPNTETYLRIQNKINEVLND